MMGPEGFENVKVAAVGEDGVPRAGTMGLTSCNRRDWTSPDVNQVSQRNQQMANRNGSQKAVLSMSH
jgi:hypothetical protein